MMPSHNSEEDLEAPLARVQITAWFARLIDKSADVKKVGFFKTADIGMIYCMNQWSV